MAKDEEHKDGEPWLINVHTKQGGLIHSAVKRFIVSRNVAKEAKLKRDAIKEEIVTLVRESDLTPIDDTGKIKVTIDGFTITVSPQDDSLSVKETTTGEEE